MRQRNFLYSLILFIAGIALISAAATISTDGLRLAMVSDPARSLEWGPALFRILLVWHGVVLMVAGAYLRNHEEERTPVAERTPAWIWIALGAMSLVALGLRVWRLESDLWFDEVLTLVDFVRLPMGDLLTVFPSQNQHMFFSFLARLSIKSFGESAWALRLPSVVFGIGSIWALFLLGRLVIGAGEALAACALMTVSYHHIWFSQNARGYMGLLCLAIMATWLWMEASRRDGWDGWAWWGGYIAAVSLGMWMHMTMVFVLASHGMVYLMELLAGRLSGVGLRQSFRWRPLIAWILCVTVTMQLYALALPEFLRVGLHEVSLPSEWTNPLWVLTESLRSFQLGWPGLTALVVASLIGGAVWIGLFQRNWRAALLLTLPGVLAGGTMLALRHNFWPRFFFFCLGYILLIAVYGAIAAPSWLGARWKDYPALARWGRGTGWLLAGLLIVASGLTVPRNYRLPKQDFSGARQFVEQQRRIGEGVVAVGLAGVAYRRYYAPHWTEIQSARELESFRQSHATVWLVYTIPIEVKAYRPDVWQAVERDYEVVRVFPGTLGGGEVFVCRNR